MSFKSLLNDAKFQHCNIENHLPYVVHGYEFHRIGEIQTLSNISDEYAAWTPQYWVYESSQNALQFESTS